MLLRFRNEKTIHRARVAKVDLRYESFLQRHYPTMIRIFGCRHL
jgi:hypothetical protein